MASETTGTWGRYVPADVVGVLAVVGLANVAVFHPVVGESLARTVVGLAFVLFVPGYALIAALFPERGEASDAGWRGVVTRAGSGHEDGVPAAGRGIDAWERTALGVAASLAVVPLLALAVAFSPLPFATVPVFGALSAFIVLCLTIATVRRWALEPGRRFRVPVGAWLARRRRSLTGADTRGEAVLTVALVAAMLFAVGTLGFAVLSPSDGETYTDFYVLSEDESGEPVAAGYPDSLTPGQEEAVYLGIENAEHRTVEYHVVGQLQRVDGTGADATVTDRRRIDSFSTTLDHGAQVVLRRSLTAPQGWTGTDLRLQFKLYRGSPPDSATDPAYREIHIWVDVGNGADGTSGVNSSRTSAQRLSVAAV